eukprot:Skav223787  [mRNA]  locus=scaffold575:334525:338269:- [translate_table: standard]
MTPLGRPEISGARCLMSPFKDSSSEGSKVTRWPPAEWPMDTSISSLTRRVAACFRIIRTAQRRSAWQAGHFASCRKRYCTVATAQPWERMKSRQGLKMKFL